MKTLAVIMLSFVASACFSKKVSEKPLSAAELSERRDQEAIVEIQNHLEKEEFEQSHKKSSQYLLNTPLTKNSQLVNYYLSRSLEGLKRWDEAAESYRSIVRSNTSPGSLVAKSLYRLSFCYEALKQDDKVIASLLDVLKRKNQIEQEIALAEVPARIAAAYARMGNRKLAEKYYANAEVGIKEVRRVKQNAELSQWLPKTLYYMGNMTVSEVDLAEFEKSLLPVEKAQAYLLQATELSDEYWSAKASGEIQKIYSDLIAAIQKVPLKENIDTEIAERERQQRRWQMATATLETLRKLKLNWVPLHEPVSKDTAAVFVFLDNKEVELSQILDEREIGSGITPEVQRRQGIKRKGKVKDPNPVLEEMAKQREKK